MISIILAIILGVGFTFIASQNPLDVSINLFGTSVMLPLYMIVGVSFLLGVGVALVFHLFEMIGAAINLESQEHKTRDIARTNQNLQAQIERIVGENRELRNQLLQTKSQLKEAQIQHRKENVKNFFSKIKHSVSP